MVPKAAMARRPRRLQHRTGKSLEQAGNNSENGEVLVSEVTRLVFFLFFGQGAYACLYDGLGKAYPVDPVEHQTNRRIRCPTKHRPTAALEQGVKKLWWAMSK